MLVSVLALKPEPGNPTTVLFAGSSVVSVLNKEGILSASAVEGIKQFASSVSAFP